MCARDRNETIQSWRTSTDTRTACYCIIGRLVVATCSNSSLCPLRTFRPPMWGGQWDGFARFLAGRCVVDRSEGEQQKTSSRLESCHGWNGTGPPCQFAVIPRIAPSFVILAHLTPFHTYPLQPLSLSVALLPPSPSKLFQARNRRVRILRNRTYSWLVG